MLTLHSVYMDDMHPTWRVEESPTPYDILIFVIRGELVYFVDGVAVQLQKGDCLYIPKGTVRSAMNAPNQMHQKYSAHFLIDDDTQFPLPKTPSFFTLNVGNMEYIQQRFTILSQQWLSHLPYYSLVCHGILLEILGLIGQDVELKQFSPAKLQLVKMMQQYLIEHYREAVTIEALSNVTKRTPNYVTNTFKEITGMTPITYMHHLRMQTAVELMRTTQLTIREISDYLGYNDQSYFNRMFKKMMGYPPSTMHSLHLTAKRQLIAQEE